MKSIERVGVLGAGALGSMYAAMFDSAASAEVFFIAEGERRERLEREGVVVNGAAHRIPVMDAGTQPVDLLIVALKHHHLRDALQLAPPFVGKDTLVISVMNGLRSEEIIGTVVNPEQVLPCVALGMDAVRDGNTVSYSTPGRLYVGEPTNDEPTPRVRRVQEALSAAGVPYETPPDMLRIMWWKFMINVGMNQSSAVLRQPYGVFQNSADAKALMDALMREVVALARPAEVDLSEQDIVEWYAVLNSLSPEGKTSMLQDIEAGRKTEVEVFAGDVVDMGRRYAVPTPVNETFLRLITVMEEVAGR